MWKRFVEIANKPQTATFTSKHSLIQTNRKALLVLCFYAQQQKQHPAAVSCFVYIHFHAQLLTESTHLLHLLTTFAFVCVRTSVREYVDECMSVRSECVYHTFE